MESVLELEVVTSCGVGSDAEIDVDDDAAVVLELCGADEAALITLPAGNTSEDELNGGGEVKAAGASEVEVATGVRESLADSRLLSQWKAHL